MAHQHSALSRLLTANAQWALDVEETHPGFFKQLAQGQSPKVCEVCYITLAAVALMSLSGSLDRLR
jgi:hypothetical protein